MYVFADLCICTVCNVRHCKAVTDINVHVCMLTDTLQALELQRSQREKK